MWRQCMLSHNLFWASDYSRPEVKVLQQTITLLFSRLVFYPADFVLAALRINNHSLCSQSARMDFDQHSDSDTEILMVINKQ